MIGVRGMASSPWIGGFPSSRAPWHSQAHRHRLGIRCAHERVRDESRRGGNMTTDAIVIVGAGHAGGRTAEALRAAGVSAPIHLIGEERYPPYERPPLSKELLTGKIAIEKTYIQ